MSVLPFEGTHLILFGDVRIADGSRIRDAYLARPDLAGSYASVVLVPPKAGVTSGVKDLCRRIARHGIAVVAMDPYRGAVPGRGATAEQIEEAFAATSDGRVGRDLAGVVRWLRSPGTEWADPERIGLLGLGTGGRWVLLNAADLPVGAVAVCYSPLDDVGPAIEALTEPLLGIYGRADETVDILTLGQLAPERIDMLTLVLIGNSESRIVAGAGGRLRVYTPRGYGREDRA